MNQNNNIFANLKSDIPAGVIVFLVAMPLCLGMALASGAPLFSGIIAGIIGGIVVGALSGSQVGVSGPAAGLIAIILNGIAVLGNFEAFLFALIIAGVMQIALGALKAGIIAYYFPASVIKGMLTGIGVIIIKKQIPLLFGYTGEENFFSFLVSGNDLIASFTMGAIVIGIISILIMVAWETQFMKNIPITKIIQAPLIVVVLGILYTSFLSIPGFELSANQLVSINIVDSFESFKGLFRSPDFTVWNNPQVYVVAATLAVVASIETLLCVEATDKMDPEKRVTPANRELFAQGVGNVLSGFIGGLPITQVIVRSSANIQSGGKSKLSVIIHGALLLITAILIPTILNKIPYVSLATILITVGFKLAKPSLFKDMYSKGWTQFVPFMITVLGIVTFDLLVGIGMGLAVAIIHILWNNFKTPYHYDEPSRKGNEPFIIRLADHVTFLNKASILHTLNNIPANTEVIIDASNTKQIDADVKEIINEFKEKAEMKNIKLDLVDFDKVEQEEDSVDKLYKHFVAHTKVNESEALKAEKV
ncbi:SulP family inorganic anion transporter [Aureibacter tunicatorum]|uniref:MFS superfamily sulfate permease-like transporter n=1 Tax=Aureibacter tunicatorum TaxID=866807 RepID=A0AAE3XMU4_9BACT|nr:SulP family inorganic anion transporter [Aureibacter tunicatorum]MDR6237919.1 MFS superfamily sulfate permease-like transporter [Aureibacter tunicatorum]